MSRKPPLSDAQWQSIRAEWEAGASLRPLAARYGLASHNSILRRCRNNGDPWTPRSTDIRAPLKEAAAGKAARGTGSDSVPGRRIDDADDDPTSDAPTLLPPTPPEQATYAKENLAAERRAAPAPPPAAVHVDAPAGPVDQADEVLQQAWLLLERLKAATGVADDHLRAEARGVLFFTKAETLAKMLGVAGSLARRGQAMKRLALGMDDPPTEPPELSRSTLDVRDTLARLNRADGLKLRDRIVAISRER